MKKTVFSIFFLSFFIFNCCMGVRVVPPAHHGSCNIDVVYMTKVVESAIEAFGVYDKLPRDEMLTYAELEEVPDLAVTPEAFTRDWDVNKDGHLNLPELITAV